MAILQSDETVNPPTLIQQIHSSVWSLGEDEEEEEAFSA